MNVGVSIGDEFLAALKAVEAKHQAKRQKIAEADYEVEEEQEAD